MDAITDGQSENIMPPTHISVAEAPLKNLKNWYIVSETLSVFYTHLADKIKTCSR